MGMCDYCGSRPAGHEILDDRQDIGVVMVCKECIEIKKDEDIRGNKLIPPEMPDPLSGERFQMKELYRHGRIVFRIYEWNCYCKRWFMVCDFVEHSVAEGYLAEKARPSEEDREKLKEMFVFLERNWWSLDYDECVFMASQLKKYMGIE